MGGQSGTEGRGAGIGTEVRKLEEGLQRCWERG